MGVTIMICANTEASVTAYGETLTVRRNPENGMWHTSLGTQHCDAKGALRDEVREMFELSGEDPDEFLEQIESILEEIVYQPNDHCEE
jgi:hypothetical protein